MEKQVNYIRENSLLSQSQLQIENPEEQGEKVSEPLLEENPQRFVIFPIKYGDVWKSYKNVVIFPGGKIQVIL